MYLNSMCTNLSMQDSVIWVRFGIKFLLSESSFEFLNDVTQLADHFWSSPSQYSVYKFSTEGVWVLNRSTIWEICSKFTLPLEYCLNIFHRGYEFLFRLLIGWYIWSSYSCKRLSVNVLQGEGDMDFVWSQEVAIPETFCYFVRGHWV